MTDVDRLFKEYMAEHRGGDVADPTPYVSQLEGVDRSELSALIDAYLARVPGDPWDEDAYAGSPAERLVESLHESLAGSSGSWPVLLPQLRHAAKIKREQLVERLADAIGADDREEKVAYYYNQMEHGQLRPDGVSDGVLDALAGIVGSTRDALRRAGQAVGPASSDAVFARVAPASEERAAEGMASPGRPTDAEGAEAERDEIDELFLGG